jgi:hypothetical protein
VPKDDWEKAKRKEIGQRAIREGRAFFNPKAKKKKRPKRWPSRKKKLPVKRVAKEKRVFAFWLVDRENFPHHEVGGRYEFHVSRWRGFHEKGSGVTEKDRA